MDINSDRKDVLLIGVLAIFALIVIKLFFIQIINSEYRESAQNNALKFETRYPARGLIRDREGRIIVGNKITYDIHVTPYNVPEFDTLEFCRIFDIDTSFINERFRFYRAIRRKIGYQSVTLLKQISGEQYNVFVEKGYMFPGFEGVPRTSRTYNYNAGGNLLGYISEVDQDYIRKHPEYRSGDYAGRTGMEEAYEEILRGQKGYTIYLRDAHNQIKEHYRDGEKDVAAVAGKDVITTIDAPLQAYGEKLMRNKVGSLVAIEPSTGEILTMVSSPGIDVSQLAEINKYYNDIVSNPYRPMYNRATQGQYPLGSVFKIIGMAAALETGIYKIDDTYMCGHYWNELDGIELHDWTAFQIIACFGQVIFDPAPHMSYRQHGGNVIGAYRPTMLSKLRNAMSFWNGPQKNSRSRQALRLERAYSDGMSPDRRELTALYAHYREDRKAKRKLLMERKNLSGTARFLFILAIFLNRL